MNNPYFELITHAWRRLLFSLFLCFHRYDFEKKKREQQGWLELAVFMYKIWSLFNWFFNANEVFFYLHRLYRFDGDGSFFRRYFCMSISFNKILLRMLSGRTILHSIMLCIKLFFIKLLLASRYRHDFLFIHIHCFAQYEIGFQSVKSHALCTIGKKIQNSSFTCKKWLQKNVTNANLMKMFVTNKSVPWNIKRYVQTSKNRINGNIC